MREFSRERRKTDEGQKMRTMEKGKEENDLAAFFLKKKICDEKKSHVRDEERGS